MKPHNQIRSQLWSELGWRASEQLYKQLKDPLRGDILERLWNKLNTTIENPLELNLKRFLEKQ